MACVPIGKRIHERRNWFFDFELYVVKPVPDVLFIFKRYNRLIQKHQNVPVRVYGISVTCFGAKENYRSICIFFCNGFFDFSPYNLAVQSLANLLKVLRCNTRLGPRASGGSSLFNFKMIQEAFFFYKLTVCVSFNEYCTCRPVNK